jgi:hypothetical protein
MTDPAAAAAAGQAPKTKMSPGKALGALAVMGLTSPFLGLSHPPQGFISLIILFVGLRIAWRITAGRPVIIVGPISEQSQATPG